MDLMDLMGVLPPPMLWMSMLPRDRDQKHQIRPIFDGFPARIVSWSGQCGLLIEVIDLMLRDEEPQRCPF